MVWGPAQGRWAPWAAWRAGGTNRRAVASLDCACEKHICLLSGQSGGWTEDCSSGSLVSYNRPGICPSLTHFILRLHKRLRAVTTEWEPSHCWHSLRQCIRSSPNPWWHPGPTACSLIKTENPCGSPSVLWHGSITWQGRQRLGAVIGYEGQQKTWTQSCLNRVGAALGGACTGGTWEAALASVCGWPTTACNLSWAESPQRLLLLQHCSPVRSMALSTKKGESTHLKGTVSLESALRASVSATGDLSLFLTQQ